MYFSEYFRVSEKKLSDYGAFDISLVCDLPLFIDPMLIFNSDKPEYKALHDSMIKYFHFLYEKSKENLAKGDLQAWFTFSEVPNNWLGYSLSGNKGAALGEKYAKFLSGHIGLVVETHGISKFRIWPRNIFGYDDGC